MKKLPVTYKTKNHGSKKVTINLTGIIIADKGKRGFTAYFAEFPEAIADGNTVDEAQHNLLDSFKLMLDTRRVESYNEDKSLGGIIQQNFEFELA